MEEVAGASVQSPASSAADGMRFWNRLRRGEGRMERSSRRVIPPRRPSRPGNTMPLTALVPEFRPEQHQVYLDLLERALRHPEVRSVALTGSHGSGKSSVLRALERRARWRRRIVTELSLSTLDPGLAPVAPAENPAERDRSNRIQKELVKQLLYRLPTRKTPRSRFPRASTPTWQTGAQVAGTTFVLVGLAWAVATLVGWQAAITGRLELVGWSQSSFWAGVTAAAVVLAFVVWRTVAGRYALRAGVKAGTLTVSLEPTSSSYFDQYLDEIMYFFQVSKTDVVLIEDVDRFEDAVVFDTLRALNTLVNNSGQVGRRVVFVYAIRDSVLGEVGKRKREGEGEGGDGPAGEGPSSQKPAFEMERANRAKYFDVIIPIVPFVTTENARDLMMDVMEPRVAAPGDETGISPGLIRLAARHVADMRTIRSVRNEFEVHFDRLVASAPSVMPGINPNIILSLVLLRATSPDAYEKIRLTASPLDTLTKRWFDLVDENLEIQTRVLTDLRTQLENGESRESRARVAGQKLDLLRPELFTQATSTVADEVQFSGPVTDADLASVAGWEQIANGTPLTVLLWWRNRYGRQGPERLVLGSQVLARLLGMPIDPGAWRDADLDELRDKIGAARAEITFLRHHTWEQLCGRTDLTVKALPGETTSKSGRINFAGLVKAYAPTPLAQDLITHGYLPRHFARYASMFYGKTVGEDAAEYISRAIEPGVPILEYELDESAVDQILLEQNATGDEADLFDDPSIYNLDIVSYLLKHRPGAAQRVAERLAVRWGEQERSLVERFFQREEEEKAGQLAALMAPKWKAALRFTAVDAQVTPETRHGLVNAVLAAVGPGERDDLDADVGTYLSEHYAALAILTDPPDEARAATVMATVAAAGGTVGDLTKLEPRALAAATQISIYPMTATNLRALGGAEKVALDVTRSQVATRPIYDHSLVNLAEYLDALRRLDPPGTPVADPASFAVVLNDIAVTPQANLLGRVVEAASTRCRITDLSDTAPEAWPALVRNRRTDPTFGNIERYISEHGLDPVLGEFLAEHGAIITPEETPQSERLAVAAVLLAGREYVRAPATRVALAASTAPGVIPIGHLAAEDGDLVGPLLAEGLLADEPETFNPTILQRWEDFEAAVAASPGFGEFLDATTLPARHLARLLQSDAIPRATRVAVVAKLESLLAGATAGESTAIAQVLAEQRELLDLPRIERLRTSGASHASLVHLMAAQGEGLPLTDLRTILTAMGGDYARVSRGGIGTVRFGVTREHRTILARLAGVTHTGAKEVRTKKYGTNLEASLKHPSD